MKRGKLKKSGTVVGKMTCDVEQVQTVAKPIPPFSFRVSIHENTRLREGDVVFHDGAEQIVIQVNASCARIRPVTARMETRKFTPRFSEKPVEFTAPAAVSVTAISANAECDILRRLGKHWREKLATDPKG